MTRLSIAPVVIVGLTATLAIPGLAAEMSNEEIIANAASAAPKAVGDNATVITFDENLNIVELRKGTNNFTCIPDDPATPTNDPVCVDGNGLAWTLALIKKEPPPAGKIGFGYMLQGETAASNVDPFAPPPADGKWSEAGPHVMIFNPGTSLVGYPNHGEHPNVEEPFVMWGGSPYEHLMIPVPGE